eukprot:CAMPEP_0194521970 /NCGR_PEP_ID=MMETSP0253-20130528/56418_1 /TAXON_ID=2966 /ORGANISM="Noctiluca scintillans" /LENGTH=191 /DNA_ID=CAMNT_0039366363 /DNA_START=322 /DNA_END=894 /DNA_ORIENTATION=-
MAVRTRPGLLVALEGGNIREVRIVILHVLVVCTKAKGQSLPTPVHPNAPREKDAQTFGERSQHTSEKIYGSRGGQRQNLCQKTKEDIVDEGTRDEQSIHDHPGNVQIQLPRIESNEHKEHLQNAPDDIEIKHCPHDEHDKLEDQQVQEGISVSPRKCCRGTNLDGQETQCGARCAMTIRNCVLVLSVLVVW